MIMGGLPGLSGIRTFYIRETNSPICRRIYGQKIACLSAGKVAKKLANVGDKVEGKDLLLVIE
jgi:biotin carboxyl carrier protein